MYSSLKSFIFAIKKIRRFVESIGSFIEIEDTTVNRGIEWELEINRTKAAQYGAGLSDVGAAVQMVTNGIKVGEYRPLNLDREVDIRIRFPKSERNIDQLGNLNVQTQKGLVPVSSFVETNIKPATKSISRQDGKRVHSLAARTVEGAIPSVQIKKVKDWLKTADLGKNVIVGFDGFDKYNQEAAEYLVLGFIGMLFVMDSITPPNESPFFLASSIDFFILPAIAFSGHLTSFVYIDLSDCLEAWFFIPIFPILHVYAFVSTSSVALSNFLAIAPPITVTAMSEFPFGVVQR